MLLTVKYKRYINMGDNRSSYPMLYELIIHTIACHGWECGPKMHIDHGHL